MKTFLFIPLFVSLSVGIFGCGGGSSTNNVDLSKTPKLLLTADECVTREGRVTLSRVGEPVSCKTEQEVLGELQGTIEGGLCCKDVLLTVKECEEKGGIALTDPGDGSLKECREGKVKIGYLKGFIEGGLCCK